MRLKGLLSPKKLGWVRKFCFLSSLPQFASSTYLLWLKVATYCWQAILAAGAGSVLDSIKIKCFCNCLQAISRGICQETNQETDQKRIVLSSLPLTIHLPSGLKATELTDSSCPCKGCPRAWPVVASQIRIVLSALLLTIHLSSGLKATEIIVPSCPDKGFPMDLPVVAFQSRMVLSLLPLIIRLPSRLKATE